MQHMQDPFTPAYDFDGREVAAALAAALLGLDDGDEPPTLLALVDGRPRGEVLGVTYVADTRSLVLHLASTTGRVPRSLTDIDRYLNQEDVLRYVRPRPRGLPPF